MKQLIETCAYKELRYYNSCIDCSGQELRRCYTSRQELERHLQDFQLMFHPRIRRFYLRYGLNWKEKLRI